MGNTEFQDLILGEFDIFVNLRFIIFLMFHSSNILRYKDQKGFTVTTLWINANLKMIFVSIH